MRLKVKSFDTDRWLYSVEFICDCGERLRFERTGFLKGG